MSDIAEKAGEVAAEVVEESIDGVADVVEVFRNNPAMLVAAGAVGAVLGGAVGFLVARKRLESRYEELASEEIAQAKAFYADLARVDAETGEPLTPEDILRRNHGEEALTALEIYEGIPLDQDADVPPEKLDVEEDEALLERTEAKLARQRTPYSAMSTAKASEDAPEEVEAPRAFNTFVDDTFDYEAEVALRREDEPYIITHEEFYAGEKEYETAELVYWQADRTLLDEREVVMENVNATVGEANLARFGSGSRDPNIVFVRNDRLGLDYEITRSMGSYAEEALGFLKTPDDGRQ